MIALRIFNEQYHTACSSSLYSILQSLIVSILFPRHSVLKRSLFMCLPKVLNGRQMWRSGNGESYTTINFNLFSLSYTDWPCSLLCILRQHCDKISRLLRDVLGRARSDHCMLVLESTAATRWQTQQKYWTHSSTCFKWHSIDGRQYICWRINTERILAIIKFNRCR
jgi:hypothetical protein